MHADFEFPSDSWAEVLNVSTAMNMPKIRERAIEQIEKADPPVEASKRVSLAHQFQVEKWLRPAYYEMIQRTEPMTKEEVEAMGIETSMKVVKARDRVRQDTMLSLLQDALKMPPTYCHKHSTNSCLKCFKTTHQFSDVDMPEFSKEKVQQVITEVLEMPAPTKIEEISIVGYMRREITNTTKEKSGEERK
jgi:hypothetical protein